MDAMELWRAWPVAGPWRLTRLAGGTNNETLRAETSGAEAYVLRIYRRGAELGRVRYEAAVTGALAGMGLPFAVPAPIATRAGEPILRIEGEDDGGAGEDAVVAAVLRPFVAGEPPARRDVELARAAGEALGRLDAALARIESGALPPGGTPPLGDLRRRVPSVPDARRALGELPVDEGARGRLLRLLEEVEMGMPALYATLPRQLIHGDFDPGNVLTAGGRVTGVLDFEFCGVDLRAADLVPALYWWPVGLFGTGREWPLLDALGRGYTSMVALTAAEVEAQPLLLRLRAAGSLLHRIGLWRRGLASEEEVLRRVEVALAREEWLAAQGARLVELGRGWERRD